MDVILRHYQPTDFKHLKDWITDPEILFQFAGPDFTFPIDSKQISNYQEIHKDRQFYIAEFQHEPVAFGEIIPQNHSSVRLGRLLVGKERGKGLGTAFVNALLNEVKHSYFVGWVDLFVMKSNLPAIRCYKKAGFILVKGERIYIQDHRGNEHPILKMNCEL